MQQEEHLKAVERERKLQKSRELKLKQQKGEDKPLEENQGDEVKMVEAVKEGDYQV